MAFPSGTFSASISGPLQISFSGAFYMPGGTYWNPAGSAEIWIGCTVTDGTNNKRTVISAMNPTSTIDWDYVTGTTLTCEMVLDYQRVTGIEPATATNLRIRGILMKR